MEMEQVILRLESIQKRAENGVSELCAVDGCCNIKKTPEARTCSECARTYSGIARRVDKAVEDYKKTAFIYECKENSRKMVESKETEKLGPQAWKALQQEIKTAVAGQEVPDELIVKALSRRHPDFSKFLCQKAVGNFRKWQRFLEFVRDNFEIDLWIGDSQKTVLAVQIQDSIDETEFVRYGRNIIVQACWKVFPTVKENIIRQMEKFAQEVTIADAYFCSDLKSSAYEKACEISNREGRIEGYAFKKLLRAVAERMSEFRKNAVKAGNLAEFKAKEAEKLAKSRIRKTKRESKRQEILAGERIAIWRKSDGVRFPDAISVYSEEDANLLPRPGQRLVVMLGEKVLSVTKAKVGGRVDFQDITSEVVFSAPVRKLAEKINKPVIKLTNLQKVWIVCSDVSSEAEKVFRLTLEQMADEEILVIIPEGELVAEIAGDDLYKKKAGQLIKVGSYRQLSKQEKKAAKQAARKARAKEDKKSAKSDFARVVHELSPEVSCQTSA